MSKSADEVLVIGYDCTDGKDITTMTVGTLHNGFNVDIFNVLRGEEAELMYKTLKGDTDEA